MTFPPVPANEAERLAALQRYELLDQEKNPAFERITSLAARMFQVPVALVTVVDRDKQHFKSHCGVDVRETPRNVAFCAYAILSDEVFVLEDASQDPRFADNPLVAGETPVRFYAGAPLRMPGGVNLGALCLIDTVPRAFDAKDRAALADLAALVAENIEASLASRELAREAAARGETQKALSEAEARFQRIVANTPGMVYQLIWHAASPWTFSFVSEGCREIFGLDPQRFYDQPEALMGVIHPEDLPPLVASLAHSAQTLQPWTWEGRLQRPDGALRWVQGWSRPERLPGGEALMDGILIDVTERKLAQQRSENSHSLLRTIIEGTDDAIYIKDREGRYLLVNPACAAYFGRRPEEIVGQDDFAFFSPETARSTRQHDQQVFRTGLACTYEDDGSIGGVERTFLSSKNPFRNASGEIAGVIGLSRDITQRKQTEAALHQAKEEAEKANRAKSEFLSRMSHELRTPLNAILGFGQLLEMSDLETKNQEGVAHILQAGRHLLGLIDEVLEISRIEAGRMRLSLEPVCLGEVVQECRTLMGRLAERHGVTCETTCDASTFFVLADRQRLRQVLLNLLTNAIKYNRQGGRATLTCRECPPGAAPAEGCSAEARLRIEVSDTGMGMSHADIARLFTPFERLGAADGHIEGTGLGLALSKGLVDAMGGCIGVASVPGEGSTFWLELPMAQNPTAQFQQSVGEVSQALPDGRIGTVLYVEDNASNLRLIECMLEHRPGIRLLSTKQGSLGLEMARASQPGLILLDLHLPDVPGWDVLRQLRSDPTTVDIPVAVISADATQGQIARLMEAGACDYLTKPLDVRHLFRLLDAVFAPAEQVEFAGME